jgi:hypothetical protein
VPVQSGSSDCSRSVSAAQSASTLGLTPLFHAGTAQTLVINGKTANGTLVRCADLTSQTAVADNDFVPAYNAALHRHIHLFDNTTQLANNCQRTLAAGDTVASITKRWAKL